MANIMIADDSAVLRIILKNMLEEAGHSVVEQAENGREAAEKYREMMENDEAPDLVFMDITMPIIDGIEAVREIKRMDDAAQCVMCASLTSSQTMREATKAGALCFIGKPYNEQSILAVARQALASAPPKKARLPQRRPPKGKFARKGESYCDGNDL